MVAAVPAMAAPASRPSWRERWLGLRNNLIASPRFQRWAAGFPLTRPTARRNARALFDLVAGFVYSQVLAACVRLRVFDMLAEGPRSIADLAPRLRLTEDAAIRLLKAAAALDLTEQLPDGRFGLGQLGAALRGNPSLTGMIEHHAMLYADLSDPVALLRGELESPQLKAFWAYAKNSDPAAAASEQVRAYSSLMADTQAMVAGQVLDAYPLNGHRKLLDVGGGEGVFLSAAGERYSNLDLMLFDLPAVAERAQKRFEAAGLAGRTRVIPGDFFRDPLPSGADVVSLVRVLHDHDDAFALAILHKVHGALPKGGTLLVAEPMSGTAGAEPIGDAYFGFYLAAMGSGRPRTAEEIAGFLRQTGFQRPQLIPTRTPMVVRVMVATA
jgi:demethylspheroidene O-methyltransferase